MNAQPAKGPFPFQPSVKRLKPSLGKITPLIFAIGFLFGEEELRKGVIDWLGTPVGIVVIIALAAVIFVVIANLLFKRIYYNASGVGLIQGFGAANAHWFSFDELQDGRFKLRKGRGKKKYDTGDRVVLNFQGGTVRFWPSFYDDQGVSELLGLISRRFPDRYPMPGERSRPAPAQARPPVHAGPDSARTAEARPITGTPFAPRTPTSSGRPESPSSTPKRPVSTPAAKHPTTAPASPSEVKPIRPGLFRSTRPTPPGEY